MKILVTGAAGFIGAALCQSLAKGGYEIIGIDNHDAYYATSLKDARVDQTRKFDNYTHFRVDIADKIQLEDVFRKTKPTVVVNLAGQAGVRYSTTNPQAYINSNLVGFANVLEACRIGAVRHLVYASSSSVYGADTRLPFSTRRPADHPISLYAATKRANELMAHSYSHLYGLPTTGLRFFTVYGPWGRPDMALFKFTKAMLAGEPLQLYNMGNHRRDFTYIDDVVAVIERLLVLSPKGSKRWDSSNPDSSTSSAPWKILNVGCGRPISILKFVEQLEAVLGIRAIKEFVTLQAGDLLDTFADASDLQEYCGYVPSVSVEEGIIRFVDWYKSFYQN
jgi:UDP-glucuronate 4-epimerase